MAQQPNVQSQVQQPQKPSQGFPLPDEVDLNEPTKFHRLDRTKAHGEIHPPFDGAYFDQNGFPYSQTGQLLVPMLSKEQRERLRRYIVQERATKAAKKAMEDTLRAQGFEEDDIDRLTNIELKTDPDKLSKKPAARGDIDLRAWATGQMNYPFDHVQAAMKETHGRVVTTVVDALNWLGDHYKLPNEQLRNSV